MHCIAIGMHTSGNNTYTYIYTRQYLIHKLPVCMDIVRNSNTAAGSIIIYTQYSYSPNRREYKLIDTSQQIKYNLATNHLEQWAAINQSVCDSAQCI